MNDISLWNSLPSSAAILKRKVEIGEETNSTARSVPGVAKNLCSVRVAAVEEL